MKLIILTAEPENFVPVELVKNATAEGHSAEIINIDRTYLYEATEDAAVMVIPKPTEDKEQPAPYKLEGDVCIPRLSEHNLEFKLGLLKRLVNQGIKLLNSPESMELCNDKLQTQIILNSNGIKTPSSTLIASSDGLLPTLTQLEDQGKLNFPIIIKTLRGTHGIGVMKADSKSSLVSIAQVLLKKGMHFMLQDFIKHEDSKRMIMLGKSVLAANTRSQPKDKDEFRTNSHLGSTTEKLEVSQEEIELGQKIVELFGCNFCAIDYIVVDGKFIVLEVNGSPGLEAIQKDWEGEKNLPLEVVRFCATFTEPTTPEVVSNAEPVVEPEQTAEPSTEPSTEPEQTAEPSTEQTPDAVNETEHLIIKRIIEDGITARVDTGAKYSSLHATDIQESDNYVSFKRGDSTYRVPVRRMIKVRNANGKTRRPIVAFDVVVKGVSLTNVEFTLNDRADMTYEALIGRDMLIQLGMPVRVSAVDGLERTDLRTGEVEEE